MWLMHMILRLEILIEVHSNLYNGGKKFRDTSCMAQLWPSVAVWPAPFSRAQKLTLIARHLDFEAKRGKTFFEKQFFIENCMFHLKIVYLFCRGEVPLQNTQRTTIISLRCWLFLYNIQTKHAIFYEKLLFSIASKSKRHAIRVSVLWSLKWCCSNCYKT